MHGGISLIIQSHCGGYGTRVVRSFWRPPDAKRVHFQVKVLGFSRDRSAWPSSPIPLSRCSPHADPETGATHRLRRVPLATDRTVSGCNIRRPRLTVHLTI